MRLSESSDPLGAALASRLLVHGPGTWHGSHTTDVGCTLMFIQHPAAGPDDSFFE
jgi:hypothetical protein